MTPLLFITPLIAQIPGGLDQQTLAKPVVLMVLLAILSLAPFFLMMTTSFVKISVVFSLIRSAIGTQQIPPNTIITGLALILTFYIMMPVASDIYQKVSAVVQEPLSVNQDVFSWASVDTLKKALDAGKEPMRDFLLKHAEPKERSLFYNLAKQLRGNRPMEELGENDFIVIVPAFVISELSEAFEIGFVIFLPFLVIDLVISNILLSMGMFMVSPVTISLPFKLLLFVLVDGWYLITKGLIIGYIK